MGMCRPFKPPRVGPSCECVSYAVSTGPVVVRLAGMANERERERVSYRCRYCLMCDSDTRPKVSSTYRYCIQNRVQQHAAYVDGGILVHAICFHRGLYSSDAHGECHDHGPVCACRTRRGAQPQSLRTTFLLGTSPATSASSASASATSRGIHRGFLERMQSSGGRGVYLRQNGAQGAF